MKWIRNFYQSFVGVPPMFLDGCLAVGIATLTALSLGLAQEDSYKYVNPVLRFWLVLGTGALVQGLHALSKFRDGTFTRHNDAKERKAIADDTSATLQAHPHGVTTQQTVTQKTTVAETTTPATPSATGS